MFEELKAGHVSDRLVMRVILVAAIFLAGYLAGEAAALTTPAAQIQQLAHAKG